MGASSARARPGGVHDRLMGTARGGGSFELRMAWRYLTTRRREGPVALVTLLCTAGVLLGVAALVVALALTAGLQGSLRERLLSSNPQVFVRPSQPGATYG